MNTLKETIKELAIQQPMLKNQRKSVKIVGERTMSEYDADMKHKSNRITLRELNVAYGILRGRTQEEIERNPKEPVNFRAVEKLIEQYGGEFRTDNTGDTNG